MPTTPNGTEYTLHTGRFSIEMPRNGRHRHCKLLYVRINNQELSVDIPCFSCSSFRHSNDYYEYFENRLTSGIMYKVESIPYNCARSIAREVSQGNIFLANMGVDTRKCLEAFVVQSVSIYVPRRWISSTNVGNNNTRVVASPKRVKVEVLREMVEAKEGDWMGKKWVASENMCSICLDEIERPRLSLKMPSCGHVFHEKCLLRWLNKHNNCPLCRFELPIETY